MRCVIKFIIPPAVFLLLIAHATGHAQPVADALTSGLAPGANCPAFDPMHVSGPDKGKRACPMCKYGQQQGIMLWINTEDLSGIGRIAERLEQEIAKRGFGKMRVFVVFMNPGHRTIPEVEKKLQQFVALHELDKVAVTYIPDPSDEETAGMYEINPDAAVESTTFVYKRRGVYRKYINLKSDDETIDRLIRDVGNAEKDKGF